MAAGGLCPGWLLLRINKLSVEGLSVKEVAPMFRDRMEVRVMSVSER